MRTRTLSITAVSAALALAVTACTSGEAESSPTQDDDTVTSADDGLLGTEGTRGWMCQYISPTAIELANGGEPESPRMLTTQDDEEGWVCQVLVGGPDEQEPVIQMGIELGEEARDAARARAEEADGVEPGPGHLGVSFVSPGKVTGLTLCTAPGATDRADKIPYVLTIESFGQTDPETTEHLERALTEAAKSLDMNLSCSPKQAVRDDEEQSTGR